jgi:hypothetical protein
LLTHVAEKWEPVSDKDMRKSKSLERITIQPDRDALEGTAMQKPEDEFE